MKMSIGKKVLGLVMVLIMTLGSISGVSATTNASTIVVTIDGQRVTFAGQGPVIVSGRTLVPVRAVFEALGFVVGWDGDARRATMTRGNDTIVMTIGSATFTTNGVAHTLDVPAQIINGSTMVPIRLPLESVGYNLEWDGPNNTVVITTGGSNSNTGNPSTGTSLPPTTGGVTVTQDAFALTFATANNVRVLYPDQVRPGVLHQLIYNYPTTPTTTSIVNWSVESNNPDVVWVSSGACSNNRRLFIQVHQAGTAIITLSPIHGGQQVDQITITVTPINFTATANQNGVHLTGPVFLTQDDIQRMLPYARQPADLVAIGRTDFNTIEGSDRLGEWREEMQASEFRHPNRPMTEQELQAWIERYNDAGGINALELEMLYLINAIRIEYDLNPLILCPNLSMASRLTSQLTRYHEVRFERHTDPFYGSSTRRAQLFSPYTIGVTESIQGGPVTSGSSAIAGWLNSPGHRAQMLSPNMVYIGVGSGGFTAVKQVVSG